jgi:hypothetical protein
MNGLREGGVGRTSSSSNKNLLNFTVKLTPSQVQYLESLAETLEASTEASAVREVLEQLQRWFYLPAYQREGLQKDLADRKVNILRYIQELLARHYEELAKAPAPAKRPPALAARSWRPGAVETMEVVNIRVAPSVLAYADTLKPQLGVATTADVIREIVGQFQGWFDLPAYQAERLQQDMAARRLNVIEYVQEMLARRYEALRDEDRGPRR